MTARFIDLPAGRIAIILSLRSAPPPFFLLRTAHERNMIQNVGVRRLPASPRRQSVQVLLNARSIEG
jgi:hypothetical protein